MNADDVVFSFARVFDQKHPYHDVNGGEYPISTACSSAIRCRA